MEHPWPLRLAVPQGHRGVLTDKVAIFRPRGLHTNKVMDFRPEMARKFLRKEAAVSEIESSHFLRELPPPFE